MTVKANHSPSATRCPSPLVLFGIDSRGKPKAARFGREHASLAIKAATQLQLNVLASNDPRVAEIAARLPVGRVHATGRTFVPFIRRDLYDRLVAAAPNGNLRQPLTPPASGASGGAAGSLPSGTPNLPRNWREIGLGDLVVAQENLDDGWYEAIVIEADGDMLTLRWREEGTTKQAQQITPPTANRYPKTGTRSTSTISCWLKTTANGGRGGKRFQSRKSATGSSSDGARNMPPTSR
jgi:hypothetical protein